MLDDNQTVTEGKLSGPDPSLRGDLALTCWRSVVEVAGGDAALIHQVLLCRDADPGGWEPITVESLASFVGLDVAAAQVAVDRLLAVGLVEWAGLGVVEPAR